MIYNDHKQKICLKIISVIFYQNIAAVPIQCGLESNCTVTPDSAVCILDETKDYMCIRKYPSKCHMDIAACKQGRSKSK